MNYNNPFTSISFLSSKTALINLNKQPSKSTEKQFTEPRPEIGRNKDVWHDIIMILEDSFRL